MSVTVSREVDVEFETDDIEDMVLENFDAEEFEGLAIKFLEDNGDSASPRRLLGIAGACLETVDGAHEEREAVAEWLAHQFGEYCNPQQQMRMAQDMTNDINDEELTLHLVGLMKKLPETNLVEAMMHLENVLKEKRKATEEGARQLVAAGETLRQLLTDNERTEVS